jgi:hypothetical protein
MRYMGKGTKGLQKIQDEIHAENEGVAISVQARGLASPHSITENRPMGEISASSVVFVVKGHKVGRRQIKEVIRVAGVQYRVRPFMNVDSDRICHRGCGWGHIESECSGNPACGYF